MSNAENVTVPAEGTPKESDLLDVAGILGVTPDDAAEMSSVEIAVALGTLKVQEDDRNVNSDLLTDASRIN